MAAAVIEFQFGYDFLARLRVAIDDDGNRTLANGCSRDCGANAFCPAGYEDDFVRQLQVHGISGVRKREREKLATKVEKSSVERVVDAGDEPGFVGAEIKSERGDFLRPSHAADWLGMRKLVEHFLLAAGIVLLEVAVDEGRVNPRRRNAIAANVRSEIVLGDGVGHRDDRAF